MESAEWLASSLSKHSHMDSTVALRTSSSFSLLSLQKKILENAARYVRPGGRLLYSTCTLEQDENTRMRKWFLENHPEFVSVPFSHPVTGESLEELQILPQRDGINGFYLCLFAKRK